MPWFPVDDSFHSHPKPGAASLTAIGLWTLAGSWSSHHLTDGLIPDHMVSQLSRGQVELAKELVDAGLWRRVRGGYRFHQWAADGDGSARNMTRQEAMTKRSRMASGGSLGNHRRWHVDQGITKPDCAFCQQEEPRPPNRPPDQLPESGGESRANPPSPIPSPSPEGTESLGAGLTGGQSVRAGARMREARRWLHDRYGLTDDEADQVIGAVSERSKEPIKNLTRYLDRMAEGDLADIAKAAMDANRPPPPPAPHTPLWGPLAVVPDPPDALQPAEPNNAFLEAKARISRRGAT